MVTLSRFGEHITRVFTLHCFDEDECRPIPKRLITHDSPGLSSIGIYS